MKQVKHCNGFIYYAKQVFLNYIKQKTQKNLQVLIRHNDYLIVINASHILCILEVDWI